MPELKEPSDFIWSNHLNRQSSFVIWVLIYQACHYFSLPQQDFLNYWVRWPFQRRQKSGIIKDGGLPSLISLSRNIGQLHKYYLSVPRSCSLGIQPSIIVSNQLWITLTDNSGQYLAATALWNPSSQRNPHGNLFRDGENDNSALGQFLTGIEPLTMCILPYSKDSPLNNLSTASSAHVGELNIILSGLYSTSIKSNMAPEGMSPFVFLTFCQSMLILMLPSWLSGMEIWNNKAVYLLTMGASRWLLLNNFLVTGKLICFSNLLLVSLILYGSYALRKSFHLIQLDNLQLFLGSQDTLTIFIDTPIFSY